MLALALRIPVGSRPGSAIYLSAHIARQLSGYPPTEQVVAYITSQCSHPPGTPSATILEAVQKAERALRKAEKQNLPREALSQICYSIGATYLQDPGEQHVEPGSCGTATEPSAPEPEISVFKDAATGKHLYRPVGDQAQDAAAAAERVGKEIKQIQRANARAKFQGTAKTALPMTLPQHETAISWLLRSVEHGGCQGKAEVS